LLRVGRADISPVAPHTTPQAPEPPRRPRPATCSM
jgi:hypothetical protein